MSSMKALSLAAGLWLGCCAEALALPCTPTEADYEALANATEQSYSKADVEALDPKDQEALCKARKFYHEARGKDPRAFARTHTRNDIPARMSRFLTPQEYGEIRSAMNEVIVEDAVRKATPSRGRK
jgi:2-oxo-4-hydroxy-4-carboxy--5-ureidoimidazoline (OHCU) decarboxylase